MRVGEQLNMMQKDGEQIGRRPVQEQLAIVRQLAHTATRGREHWKCPKARLLLSIGWWTNSRVVRDYVNQHLIEIRNGGNGGNNERLETTHLHLTQWICVGGLVEDEPCMGDHGAGGLQRAPVGQRRGPWQTGH